MASLLAKLLDPEAKDAHRRSTPPPETSRPRSESAGPAAAARSRRRGALTLSSLWILSLWSLIAPAAAAIHSANKAALCVSGQLRTFSTAYASLAPLRAAFGGADVFLFVSRSKDDLKAKSLDVALAEVVPGSALPRRVSREDAPVPLYH